MGGFCKYLAVHISSLRGRILFKIVYVAGNEKKPRNHTEKKKTGNISTPLHTIGYGERQASRVNTRREIPFSLTRR